MFDERLQQVFTALRKNAFTVYIATRTADIRWLTGFSHVFDEEQAHVALMCSLPAFASHSTIKPLLFTDKRYSEALLSLNTQGNWHILDDSRPRFAYVVEQLSGVLNDVLEGSKEQPQTIRVAIEKDLRLDWFKALEKAFAAIKDTNFRFDLAETDVLSELRAIKNKQEIECLKAAQDITDRAFEHMLGFLKPGITEKQAACELEFFMCNAGADSVAFPSIVASGPNSALPHAKPSERVLCKGDSVLMDFGARLNDYCSDMTRTVVLGKANDQQRRMYAAVLAAQRAVIEVLKPGMQGLEAQRKADTVIAEYGFEGKFVHSLGHGVGIQVHELPVLGPKATTTLKIGQVVTVEPGVYLEGVGGVRIENFGVLGENGFEDFTQSTTELIEL